MGLSGPPLPPSQKLSDIDPGQKLTLLAVGKPGRGKTRGIAQFPKPMLVQSWDRKVSSMLDAIPKEEQRLVDVDMYSGPDYGKFATRMERLQDNCPYRTVFVDSLTLLALGIVEYSISLRKGISAADKNRKEFKSKGIVQIPEFEDYNTETNALNDIVALGQVIKAHFVLSAHILEFTGKNEADKEVRMTAVMTAGKKVAAMVPALFDEVWCFETAPADLQGSLKYQIRMRGDGDFTCRTNFVSTPTLIDWTNQRLDVVLSKHLPFQIK